MDLKGYNLRHWQMTKWSIKGRNVMAVALLLAATLRADPAVPRLALVASGDAQAGVVVTLMEVALSKRDDVVLLDRDKLEKVMAEHQLALDGLLSTDDAIKLGALLQCDIFAELHCAAASQQSAAMSSLVTFDVLTGVRLHDSALPADEELDIQASSAAQAMGMGLAKWQGGGPEPDCRTLSFVSIRQPDLPPELQHIPRTVGVLLERLLVNSPDIAFLERKRLDRIVQESALTGTRRDRLLASYVLVDLDLLKGNEKDAIGIKVHMTDGSGTDLGMVESAGSAGLIDKLIGDTAGLIMQKLALLPPADGGGNAVVFEANRFLSDAERLQLRGHKRESDVSATAATLLAGSALRRNPSNIALQKLQWRLHQRQDMDLMNHWDVLKMLEADFVMMEKWPSGPDTKWFLNRYCEILHDTLKRLHPYAKSKRIDTLRNRVGNWARKMSGQDSSCIQNVRSVEAWAMTPDTMLTDVGASLKGLPRAFSVSRYTSATNYGQVNPSSYFYQVEDFSLAERKKLLRLYGAWGRNGNTRIELFDRLQSYIGGAMLVNCFPDGLSEADSTVQNYLRNAGDMVLEDHTLAGPFLHLCMARGRKPPSFYKPLQTAVLAQEARRLAEALDSRRIACPLLLEYLDEVDADNADYPGAYLEKAWAQLESPDYEQPSGDVVDPRYTDWYMERIKNSYSARYGRDIVKLKENEIRIAELESMARIFEFDSVPGISSIESAEMKDDWLYLLCLHKDPRSYEMSRVHVDDKRVEVLGEIFTDLRFRARTGNEIVVGAHGVYVPTDRGLLCFSIGTTNTWTISAEDGLPCERVTACREVGETLYLGCRGREEGYLVRCDPRGNDMQLLASSGRKEKKSDLDDCAPYTVDSIVFDEKSGRLFISCMFLEPVASDIPWLWAYDLKLGTLAQVHSKPYYPLQLRQLPGGRFLLHVAEMHNQKSVTRVLPDGREVSVVLKAPSANGARGYASWSASSYSGKPLEDLADAVVPLMGSTDPEKLNVRYDTPNFCGRLHVMPGTASSATLLRDDFLVSAGVPRTPMALPPPGERYMISARAGWGKRWQLIPRGDIGWQAKDLPLLDDEAPFVVRRYNTGIVAVTQDGAWLVNPRLPAQVKMSSTKPAAVEVEALQKDEGMGRLVIKAPHGATVRVGRQPHYRVWKDGRLTWGNIAAGTHPMRIDFHGRQEARTLDIRAGEPTTVTESFGEKNATARIVELGQGHRLELVWVPFTETADMKKRAISFGKGFWMGKYEVTQAQYEAVIGDNPSGYHGASHPVDGVGRKQANAFCSEFMKKCGEQLGGLVVRLPSEEEWEYARLAGSTNRYSTGSEEEDLLRGAWMPSNSDGQTHPVGRKMPNPFWLYDMEGNVAEWCEWGKVHGWSWDSTTSAAAQGFRIVMTKPDSELGRTEDGWVFLSHVNPSHAKIGWGTFRRYKRRDKKPGIGGHAFNTVMYVHANSSIKYRLDGKYTEFMANYGLWTGAHGVCRFAVLLDGEQEFKSGHTYGRGATSVVGVRNPIKLDVTGVKELELRAVKAEGKSLANACGLWGDAKVR